jgi:hypothetical protein
MSFDAEKSKSRLFPRVTETFYKDHPSLAAFAYSPTVRDAFRRSDRNAKAVFERVMAAHREGFEADILGIWDKADYYRKETGRAISSNGEDADCWKAGAQALGFSVAGPEFRRRFVIEVVVDSYAGMFLGLLKAGMKPMERPLVHFEAVAQLQQDLQPMTEEEERDRVDPMVVAGSATGGAGFLAAAARLFPRQRLYTSLALGQLHASAAKDLQTADSAAERLKVTEKTIAAAEDIRRNAPWCAEAYGLLGSMEHERAILLANQADLRAAFEAIARASSYLGDLAVSATKGQLDQIHAALRQKVASLRAQMAVNPNARLTPQGSELVAKAENATQDAERWRQSKQAMEIEASRDKAEAYPGRALVTPPEDSMALVRTAATAKVPGEERFADWLASRQGRWARWQMAAAAALVLVTAGLEGWQGWSGHALSSARARVNETVAAGKQQDALDALGDYFAAPRPIGYDRDSDLEFAELYRSTLALWAAERARDTRALSVGDRRRIERYKTTIREVGTAEEAKK